MDPAPARPGGRAPGAGPGAPGGPRPHGRRLRGAAPAVAGRGTGPAARRPRPGAVTAALVRPAPARRPGARRPRREGTVRRRRPRHVRRPHGRRRRTAGSCVVLAHRLGARALRGALHPGGAGDAGDVARPTSAVIELSRVGLGTNNIGRRLDLGRARMVVDAAIDAGVTHIDTADTYGGGDSERFLGEILEGRRERVVIATKFGMAEGGNGSPEYVHRASDPSIARRTYSGEPLPPSAIPNFVAITTRSRRPSRISPRNRSLSPPP